MKTKKLLLAAIAVSVAVSSCKKEEEAKSTVPVSNNSAKRIAASQDNTVTDFFKRTTGAIALDQAASVKLTNGHVLWLNGDTYYNDLNTDGTIPCMYERNNTVIDQTLGSWAATAPMFIPSGSNGTVFPSPGSPDFYWPSCGYESSTANTFWVHLQRIHPVAGVGFTVVGQSIGKVVYSTKAVTITPYTGSTNGINFNAGLTRGLDGFIYLYGTKWNSTTVAADVYLARFDPATPQTWYYYKGTKGGSVGTGTNWSTDATLATALGAGKSAGTNIAYVKSKWVLITTELNFQTQCRTSDNIYASASTSMTSFPAVTKIYDIPDRKSGYIPYFYTPQLHPEYNDNTNNNFLFTYCINTYDGCSTSVKFCNSSTNKADPNEYRPRGVRVSYSTLGL